MSAWQRSFWAVYVANLVTAVGMMSFLPFFPSYLEELGVTDPGAVAAWAGVVFGAAPLAAAVMGPVWGSIGDRYGRKAMVLRAMLAITVFVGAMGLVATPWQLLLLRLAQGVFSGFVPPSITLVSVSAPPGVQGRISGTLQSALAAGSLVGPLLGALVAERLGIRSVFLVVAALSGLGALVVALFATEEAGRREAPGADRTAARVLARTWTDLRELLARPRIRSALLLLFFIQFGVGTTSPLLELYVRDVWDGDPALVPRLTGVLFTLFAGAGLVATPLWGRLGDRIGHGRALVRCAVASGSVLALHALVPVYGVVAGARLLFGLTAPGANATSFGVVATATRVERRGGAFGAAFSARALAMALGASAGGSLAALVGVRGLFVVGGALVLAAGLLARPDRAEAAEAAAREGGGGTGEDADPTPPGEAPPAESRSHQI